ncbi:MAG TPA: cell division protein ZipA C-terminal FtsZ-binding domain-containing protein [Steroidobacter sp.]|uniref:cell division protein ZipA C-terminal FtsZ-binding domain-containing protein n=1 Tax=Steroidobacter sp. TaxID=1978227 RepID=UPI002EDA2A44
MSELRWILIGFGIVLLAGIYLWGRRSGAAAPEEVALRPRTEPPMHGEDFSSDEPSFEPAYEEAPVEVPVRRPEPVVDYEVTAARPVSPRSEARLARAEAPSRPQVKEVFTAATSDVSRPLPDFRRGRVEPTLGVDEVTEELGVQPAVEETTAVLTPAPTLSSSEAPAPRRPSVRKILSLRLSLAPQRVEGSKLQEVLQGELLTHGKYEIFHRLHSDGQSVFSVASMVEPGSFDLEKMGETLYPGVTLFAQLPGPVPGMHALNELVACARRLHQSLGGVLQDDRGVPLTVHRIERMRQEVREFERPPGANVRAGSKSEG